MNEIVLNPYWKIMWTRLCWELMRKEGKAWESYGYFAHIEELYRAYLNFRMRCQDFKDLRSIRAAHGEALDEIRRSLNELKILGVQKKDLRVGGEMNEDVAGS